MHETAGSTLIHCQVYIYNNMTGWPDGASPEKNLLF